MQNKKFKHRPSTKYLYFHKITGPILFFSGENRNKKFFLPTDQNFFSMLVETAIFHALRHWDVQLILAYSWARPRILVAGKAKGGMFFISSVSSLSFLSSFFSVPLFHLLFYHFSPFLWERTQNDLKGTFRITPTQ